MSLFIPRIATFINEEMIRNEFSYTFGMVSQVDFIPINKRDGFMEENNHHGLRSAFVHFHYYFEDGLNENGIIYHIKNIMEIIDSGDSFRYQPECSTDFWCLLKNKNPVKRTMMNIHQVVANGLFLEKKVLELEQTTGKNIDLKLHVYNSITDFRFQKIEQQLENSETIIKEQNKEIDLLTRRTESLQNVVHQLLGGLFCQTTQNDILNVHLNKLFEHESWYEYYHTEENITLSNNNGNIYPTTRQGDATQRRLEALELFMDTLVKQQKK
jgi:hypothetical protein